MTSIKINSEDTLTLLSNTDAYFETNNIDIGRGETMFLKAVYLMNQIMQKRQNNKEN